MAAVAVTNVGMAWSVSVPAWLAWRVAAGVASAAVWIPLYAGLAKAFPDARTQVPRRRCPRCRGLPILEEHGRQRNTKTGAFLLQRQWRCA